MSRFLIATHALVMLAHKQTQLSSTEIAENICVNPVQVRQVLRNLVQSELVVSQQGRQGGIQLARPAEDITLADVARATRTDFLPGNWFTGDQDQQCLISSGMGLFAQELHTDLLDAVFERLEDITIASIESKLVQVSCAEASTGRKQ